METPRNNEADVLATDVRNYSDGLITEQEQPNGKKHTATSIHRG